MGSRSRLVSVSIAANRQTLETVIVLAVARSLPESGATELGRDTSASL